MGSLSRETVSSFLDVELKTSIAIYAHYRAAAVCHADPNGSGDAVSHGSQRRGMKHPLPGLDPQRQQEEFNRAARTP